MLTLTLSASDELAPVTLHLEHSLVSLSKWEQMYEKPFFGFEEKSNEETLSYIELMVVDGIPPLDFKQRLGAKEIGFVNEYMNSKMTATTFREDNEKPPPGGKQIITNELIYHWMINFQIPFQPCETWHLNRLMVLIKVCGISQTKPKKMSKQAQAEQMRQLNAERRAKYNTAG